MLISAFVISMGMLFAATFLGGSLAPGIFFELFHRTEYFIGALVRMRPTLAYFAGRLLIDATPLKGSGVSDYVPRDYTACDFPGDDCVATGNSTTSNFITRTALSFVTGPVISPSVSPMAVDSSFGIPILIPIFLCVTVTLGLLVSCILRRTGGDPPSPTLVFDTNSEAGVVYVEVIHNDKPSHIAVNPYTGTFGLAPFEIPLPPSHYGSPSSSSDGISSSSFSMVLDNAQTPAAFEYYQQEVDADLESNQDTPLDEGEGFDTILADDDEVPVSLEFSPPRSRENSQFYNFQSWSSTPTLYEEDHRVSAGSPVLSPVAAAPVSLDQPTSYADPPHWPSPEEWRRYTLAEHDRFAFEWREHNQSTWA